MNSIQRVFGKKRVFLPVIHVHSWNQADQNARVAHENGADGVLLINQGSPASVTLRAAYQVAKDYPELWVGINLLGGDVEDIMEAILGSNIRGVWSDDAGITLKTTLEEIQKAKARRARCSWEGLLLSGVAFKYQDPVPEDLWGPVAFLASQAGVDVVVTSGPATGEPADPMKLAIMRQAIGDHALGVASGVSEENVEPFLETTNVFVVSSSLLQPGTGDLFDPNKMRRLSDRIPRND